jgi:hypothetical protein
MTKIILNVMESDATWIDTNLTQPSQQLFE